MMAALSPPAEKLSVRKEEKFEHAPGSGSAMAAPGPSIT
jgi:hypothetical protein